jgi:hypothetical protein
LINSGNKTFLNFTSKKGGFGTMKAKNRFAIALLMSASVLIISAMRVCAAPHATVVGTYLEDFSRDTLLVPPGPGVALSDGTALYWNQFGKGTFSILDSVFIAKCDSFAYYRFATSGGKRYAYCIFRIKGDAKAKNNLIYTRIASQGATDSGGISDHYGTSERLLDTLVGPDSLPVPAITTQFQTIVVDMKKNGLLFGAVGGANAFQIGTHASMELDIDYVFSSNSNPLDTSSAVKNSLTGAAGTNAYAGAHVWASKASNIIMIKTGGAQGLNGILSLYDLQGKAAHFFDVRSQGRVCSIPVPAGNLRGNVYLYTLNGMSGAVLAKGKITLRQK